jgi:hypothetical protein
VRGKPPDLRRAVRPRKRSELSRTEGKITCCSERQTPRLLLDRQAPAVFSDHCLQSLTMQAQLSHRQLQPAVLILHRLQSLRLAHFHPPILRLPAIERRRADACSRQRSAVFTPASCCFTIPMICSSVNRLLFIRPLLHITSPVFNG